MRTLRLVLPLVAILASLPALSQTTTPPPPTPPTDQEEAPTATLSDAASGTYERRDNFPSINVYLPEGQASVRLRRLIRNVLFETQIDYEFVNGDISTFLRYKYYARNYTYRLGLFDSIEFPDIGDDSEQEFERVRGGLLLVGVPKDYDNRYFFLLQNDRLTFGDTDDPDNRKNNIYAKVGYQFGTPFDERMNAIVGESRGRITPVLTAFRDIGTQRTGIAAAITQSSEVATGDYHYTKLEGEGLRRFDLTSTSFIFSRLHAGAFLGRKEAELDLDNDGTPDDPETLPEIMRYTIPRYEMFRLGGREALKSVGGDDAIGTHELHLTNELFVPIFRNKSYRTGALRWNTMYGIAYVGAGTVGFDFDDVADTGNITVDAGLGTETALTLRDFDVYLSVIVAHTLEAPKDMGGTKVRFSIRTVR
ncbi:MAG TPA: hypothetical protein VGF69_05680 [Thermoanaerobaculia bacterium]|jgi:hypothetical protein